MINFFNKGLNSFLKFNLKPLYYYQKKEIIDARQQQYKSDNQLKDFSSQKNVNCLMLHPVMFPNQGPEIELCMAEEAIGLIKSLQWNVVKGPYWNKEKNQQKEQNDVSEPIIIPSEEKKEEDLDQPTGGRHKKIETARKKILNQYEWDRVQDLQLKDGDYVHTPYFSGQIYQGGIVTNLQSDSDNEGDLQDEWGNKILRQSLANSSLIKLKKLKQKYFFTKGKIYEIGLFLKANNVDSIFINSELNSLQTRNLEKHWNDIINDKADQKYFRSNLVQQSESETEVEDMYDAVIDNPATTTTNQKKLKVFDRFTIILQIFAKRANTKISKLQLQLTFYSFLKTKLMRDGGNTFSSYFNIFKGDLMDAQEIKLEIVSAKSKAIQGSMMGEGETQLEVQRRIIKEGEAKCKKELQDLQNMRQVKTQKYKKSASQLPSIALIGYTNAGKSALMNCMVKQEQQVPSHDMLFQTLNTTAREIRLQSGSRAILFDTIGFISHLPHELVESFKTTLEEVRDADIVLHIRDISHPQSEQQKKTVLKVLQDLKFEQDFYTQKMVEVWNKIDLLTIPLNYNEIEKQDSQVIPISAVFKTNLNKLTNLIEDKISQLNDKQSIKYTYGIDQHQERIEWFKKNTNITQFDDIQFNVHSKSKIFPYGSATIKIKLDEVTQRRYESHFGIAQKQERGSLVPPKEWISGSKKYFEMKNKEKEEK